MKIEDYEAVWKACRPWTGYSRATIAGITGLETEYVTIILSDPLEFGLVDTKSHRAYQEWIATGDINDLWVLMGFDEDH